MYHDLYDSESDDEEINTEFYHLRGSVGGSQHNGQVEYEPEEPLGQPLVPPEMRAVWRATEHEPWLPRRPIRVRVRCSGAGPEHGLLAAGITTWIMIQAYVNIGAVIGVLPITGVPLPFVSYGGSSMVLTLSAYGVLLNVARQTP